MEANGSGKQTNLFERSIDTEMLCQALEKAEIGELIPYETLEKAVGRSVRAGGHNTAYTNLVSARSVLEREKRIVFGVVPGEGLKRLNNSEISHTGRNVIHRVHRMTRKATKRLSCVIYEELPAEDRIKFNADASMIGALHAVSKSSSVAKIENTVKKSESKLALANTLAQFMS